MVIIVSFRTMGSLAHLLKSSLGTGILAMPMAFKNSGLLIGALGTIIITFILTHCVTIFVSTNEILKMINLSHMFVPSEGSNFI